LRASGGQCAGSNAKETKRAPSAPFLFPGTGLEALLVSTGIVALAEIGDKTQLLTLLLASRFRKPAPIVLGIFIATFLYAILVLRMVQGGESDAFVPQLSVTVALVLTLLSVGALIYFIHHTAESIQADNVIEAVRRDLLDCAHALLPDGADGPRDAEWSEAESLWQRLREDSAAVAARGSGFLQAVDTQSLESLAAGKQAVFRLLKRPGDFVMTGCELLRVSPAALVDDAFAARLNRDFILGSRRTLIQDIELPFQQLVEIALRALSPGINDPHTAIRCIDRLGDMLGEVLRRGEPPVAARDTDGAIRLIFERVTFASILGTAFDEIRQQASPHPAVVARLLDTLRVLIEMAPTEAQRQAIALQARLAHLEAAEKAGTEAERALLEKRMRAIRALLAQGEGAERTVSATHADG